MNIMIFPAPFRYSLLLAFSVLLSGFIWTGGPDPVDNLSTDSVQIKVSTYNIRYAADEDVKTGNGWDIRKKTVADLILNHGFEIVGTQEGDQGQVDDLLGLMPKYAVTAYPYGGKGDLHNGAIFYRKDRFEILGQGVFWLSETPDEPSIGWDASDRRICHWARFKDKTSARTFYFFNAHFYWRLQEAKSESGPLVAKKIQEIVGNEPVICTGDFNSTSETSQVQAIKSQLNDSFEVSETGRIGIEDTNLGGGNFIGPPKGRIDYIFVSRGIQVKDYAVFSDRYNGDRYPSDHLPVACNIGF
ncbi:MAG: endonuclease/exonuclease/phosphatase family protein [Sphingobacteriaceae bacterium]